MITAKELKSVIKERKVKKNLTRDINTFLSSINGQPLAAERLIYNEGINGTFQRKFKKQGGREFNVNTSRLTHKRFKILLEDLLLGLLQGAKLGDSWYIEYQVKREAEPR
jgi:hypothetical protein